MGFETKVPGKWILAGEHAVLRGVPALVFPLRSRFLTLSYKESAQSLELELDGAHGLEMKMLFWNVLDKACEMTGTSRASLTGSLKISSSIPIGAGLGASAALCVSMAKWFFYLGKIKKDELYEFSRTLENIFHGESSGVDIAVALSDQGLKFIRGGDRNEVEPQWQPKWFVSYSGQRGVTSECVNKVKHLITENPVDGKQIDEQMAKAVSVCEKALTMNEKEGFSELKKGIDLAADCFEKWGLTPTEHVNFLKAQGATAVKPTGSGNGGYVLSLWNKPPPANLLEETLIPCL